MKRADAERALRDGGVLAQTKRARGNEYHVIPGGAVSRSMALALIRDMRLHETGDGLPLDPFCTQTWKWRGFRMTAADRRHGGRR